MGVLMVRHKSMECVKSQGFAFCGDATSQIYLQGHYEGIVFRERSEDIVNAYLLNI